MPVATKYSPVNPFARCLALIALTLLCACSSLRPWQNQPFPPQKERPTPAKKPSEPGERSLLVQVSMSGGGARAAAFGYGVLDALRQARIQWHGRDISLLDELDVIGGVSGGSIIAAYYAAFGEATFPAFEQEFLHQDVQDSLILNMLRPDNMYDLSSPWFGRSHLLERRLNELFKGKTFGDLADKPVRPRLLVSATDLSLGSSFEFTWRQFSLICSDLASVPLSFAVAASSAVPIALSPMTLRNYSGSCPAPDLKTDDYASNDYRVRLLRSSQRSYLDASTRPFIHLVDGGLADNLGLRALLDRTRSSGGLSDGVRRMATGKIEQVVLIVVNAERDPAEQIDSSDKVPSTYQVVDSLLFGTGARSTEETLGMISDTAREWQHELELAKSADSDLFDPDAQVHVINVNLRDVPELMERRRLLQVPTAFSITKDDVSRLIDAGRQTLSNSSRFKALLKSLEKPTVAPSR